MKHHSVIIVHFKRKTGTIAVITEVSCFIHLFHHRFTFSLTENFQNVNLSTRPDLPVEGTEQFTLQYTMKRGVIEQQKWFFYGTEINTNSHYLVENWSLVILSLNRNDTGQYTVLLTNPFSSVTAHMNVTVLCKINNSD